MKFARVYSAQPAFPHATIVSVEADITPKSLHGFAIVGLPDKAVEEARDRMSAAVKNSGFPSPKKRNQKIILSLAPADLKKEGPIFDLSLALAYLFAAGEISFNPERKLFLGELALDGSLRSVRGVLPAVLGATRADFKEAYVPAGNAEEGALVSSISIYPVSTLSELVAHLSGKKRIAPQKTTVRQTSTDSRGVDWSDVRSQENAKRVLEIAAAGRHNVALYGPPGTGKTMLARAFTGILPELSEEEALEVTAIHSLAGTLDGAFISSAPLRAPHHTSSYVALVGGGVVPRPGEVTLAHRGVLFLDEFPEFDRRSIETLRQPLEDRIVSVSRARGSVRFPANFILIAAMNPTSGGAYDRIDERSRERLARKISGPIVDRIDLWSEVAHVPHETLEGLSTGATSEQVRKRVAAARRIQEERFREAGSAAHANSDMSVKDMDSLIHATPAARKTLTLSAERLGLSPRSHHRTLKIARTIADLEASETVEERNVLEALQYRPRKDMFGF